MKTKILLCSILALSARLALAAPETFDFKDPKGVNNAVFKLDAPLEAINGSASGVSGTVTFDPENPGATKGTIVVTSSSLTVPNAMQQGHMHGPMWLDVAKYPEISFEAKKLSNVKTDGNVTMADAAGTFTLKGVAKDITVPVKLTYLKDKLGARIPNMKGDLLVIRSTFTIKRSDFNIQPHQMEEKVSDDIEITLSIAGAAAK
ncbi:MAG: YceI family protein [Verrucomicrobiota bacterium]